MDRRTTIKWVLAAGAAWPLSGRRVAAAAVPDRGATAGVTTGSSSKGAVPAHGYGSDPDLAAAYQPGSVWPLTLAEAERRLASALSDLILPADDHSPSASAVGIVDFIDEWISAPYADFRQDRELVLAGFAWLNGEAMHRHGTAFADLDPSRQRAICDRICDESRAAAPLRDAARFFARYRDLTAGGYYSSPAGRKDLEYRGNVALDRFDGAPPALVKKLGLEGSI